LTYRYTLTRSFQRTLFQEVDVSGLFIGLNPSTATATQDDPTVRRWSGYARSWGWTSYYVVNLYAWRSTDPSVLKSVPDPIGPDNDRIIIERALAANGPTVCCWGDGASKERHDAVLSLLIEHGITPYALRLTKRRQMPEHVLYLPKILRPRPLSELLGRQPP
jgi:hypothetical protein